MTLWEMFESVAARFPDRVAVEIQRAGRPDESSELPTVSWTYRELSDAAVVRSAWLSRNGVGVGDRCAILADNGAQWCVTYLGTLRAGAIAVPLDTNYSAGQVATIVRDAGARILFVNERLEAVAREAVGESTHTRVVLQGGPVSPETPVSRPGAVTGADPAVILYTSGTTADPKGVVLSHANLIAERDAAFAAVDVNEGDSVLGVLPLYHALAQLANLLLPFAVGARVVYLETVNSSELVRALAERHITIFACVPQFFYLIHQRIMAEVARGGLVRRGVFNALLAMSFGLRRAGINVGPRVFGRVHALLGPQMRLFVTGGSKFDPAIGRDFYALGFTILQAYGLTETSGAATINRVHEAHLDTVGRALPGQQISIMPSDDDELDGEIAIRGPIVMQGYFNRPDATREVMRDGWFLSGDLGRLDAEGRLTITGRKKEVIVLASGKNIYPEEVEAQYRQSQFVKEICVLGLTRGAEPTTERLFAVVVPDTELLRQKRIVNAGDLLRFEIEGQSIHLPPHKRVLGYEVWFEPLPRTTTGKLKRHEIERRVRQKRQQAEERAVAETSASYAPEDSHASAAVAMIARRAKGRAITPDAYLELELGFDSMERVELIAELEQRFGVHVRDEDAHQILTVSQLIEAVRPGAEGVSGETAEDSWAVILGDLPTESDPVLGGLLEHRPVNAVLFFVLLRLARWCSPRIGVRGLEHLPADGPYIISPNHQSYLDPFFVCATLPYRVSRQLFFVGAAEYFETPLAAWLARQLKLVPVDPDANLVPAMKAGAFGLKHGKVLVLFPEGERSIDGTVKRFKKGAPILSRHLDVPVVPVAIRGVFEVWPRNRPLNWRMLLPWTRHRVRITFGAPMRFDDRASYADAANALRQRVIEMWDPPNTDPPDEKNAQNGRKAKNTRSTERLGLDP